MRRKCDAEIPPTDVAVKAKHHLLDMLASMTLGTLLIPGRKAVAYARLQAGAAEATVAGTDLITSTVNAARANGMNAHADETDDTHFAPRSHLRCGVVPAALAMAEKEAQYGKAFLKGVVLRYDIGGRSTVALGVDETCEAGHSTYSFAPLVGEAVAAGVFVEFSAQQVCWLIFCNAQQMSGVNCWQSYPDHSIQHLKTLNFLSPISSDLSELQ